MIGCSDTVCSLLLTVTLLKFPMVFQLKIETVLINNHTWIFTFEPVYEPFSYCAFLLLSPWFEQHMIWIEHYTTCIYTNWANYSTQHCSLSAFAPESSFFLVAVAVNLFASVRSTQLKIIDAGFRVVLGSVGGALGDLLVAVRGRHGHRA